MLTPPICVPCHAYPTNFFLMNFLVPRIFLKTTRFAISVRAPILWNNWLSKKKKEIDNFLLFKQRVTEKIMELSTAANFLQQKDTHLLDYLCQ